MQTTAKLAHLGTTGEPTRLAGLLGRVRRALDAASDRRPTRPLEDIDDWSDQTEVAFYESCRSSRLP